MWVTHAKPWEDALWNAVQEAIGAGIPAERFKRELLSAWQQTVKDRLEHELKILR